MIDRNTEAPMTRNPCYVQCGDNLELLKKVQSNIELKSSRKSKNNIRKHIDLYIDYLTSKNNNEKTIHGYIKKFEYTCCYG